MTNNNTPSESGLMRATAQNIENLQRAVVDLQRAASSAKEDAWIAKEAATAAREEAKRWKLLTRVLSVFVLIAMVASGLSIYNWLRAVDATNQLRTQSVISCQQGNDVRQAEVNVWNHVLDAILVPGPNETEAQKAATAKFVTNTEQYLDRVLAQRNCAQAYNSTANAQARGQG